VSSRVSGGFEECQGPPQPRIHPRRLPEPGPAALVGRGLQIASVAARHFLPVAARRFFDHRGQRLVPADFARPLRLTFENLGGTFIKFGQVMASSPGMFGEEVAEEFRSCLDTGPPVPFSEVRFRVEEDLGASMREVFRNFEPEPVGRASIAVVHRATLLDGRRVAVKIIRPGIERQVATDLDLMQPLLEILARQTGDQMAGSMLQLVDGFRVQVGEEMDLRNEARTMVHFRGLLAEIDLPRIVVPEPFFELSGPNVLTMELLDGVPIDDLAKVEEFGVDPAPLIEEVVRLFFLGVVRRGIFHGDAHAGNMLLLRDGRLGMVDWGIVGRLDPATRRFVVRLLAAVLGEKGAWDEVTEHLIATYGPALATAVGMDQRQMADFIRQLVEPTLTRPFGEFSLASLFQAVQLQLARAQGLEAHQRSLRSIVRRLRFQRRIRRLADESGGLFSDFDRATFLLTKQLMYFERYGRLFLADVPLLRDREFFQRLIEEAPERGPVEHLEEGRQDTNRPPVE
jgi:predicted unusual protein kinase regulating ubiquinone biosynthesis (AarF/ABC1/UbiB family)